MNLHLDINMKLNSGYIFSLKFVVIPSVLVNNIYIIPMIIQNLNIKNTNT